MLISMQYCKTTQLINVTATQYNDVCNNTDNKLIFNAISKTMKNTLSTTYFKNQTESKLII